MSRHTTGSRTNRTARRRRTSRPANRRDRIVRQVTLCITICMALLFTCWIAARASKPFRISYAESKEIAGLEREASRIEEENRRLRDQQDFLKTKRGQEFEARRIGFVRAGERAVIIGRPEATIDLDFPKTAPPKPRNFWQKFSVKLAEYLVRDES